MQGGACPVLNTNKAPAKALAVNGAFQARQSRSLTAKTAGATHLLAERYPYFEIYGNTFLFHIQKTSAPLHWFF